MLKELQSLFHLELLIMCQGAREAKHGGFCKNFMPEEVAASDGPTRGSISCELCGLKASLYCHADNAYLCRKCDKLVHKANFLALRHIRCFLCNNCQNLTRRYLIGASVEVVLPTALGREEGSLPNKSTDKKWSRTQKEPFQFL